MLSLVVPGCPKLSCLTQKGVLLEDNLGQRRTTRDNG